MASLQIEVASSSSPFGYSNIRDHNRSSNIKKGYIHSHSRINEDDDSSWLPVQDSKPTTDDSWLPTVASESDVSNHQKGQNKDADDSWLPTSNDANNKYLKNNHESDNDFDYSWLPSTFIENKNKRNNDNINDKNKNKTTNKKKNINKNNNNNNNKNGNGNGSNNNSGIQKKPKNDHWALAREVVFSCEQKIQNADLLEKSSDSSKRHNSPKERSTVESPSSGGVSSLLQRWRDLAEAKNSNKNDNSSPPSNRSNSESTCKENKNNKSSNSPPLRDGFAKNNNNNPSQCPPRGSNASDGVTVEKSKDSDTDWESDKTNRSRRLSCPLPSRDSKDSNNVDAEKEKIRVVDIIKKLSREEELAASSLIGGDGNESLPPIRTSRVKVSGHLIRGRHAFKVFLMRTEHDKIQELKWLVERKVVSKFPHRSRLQSMLRIRMLRLGAEPKPGVKGHKRCVSKTLESNNRLDIMDLREKFNSRVDKGETDSEKHKRNVMKNSPDEEIYITSNPTKQVDIKSKAMTKIKTKTTTINTNIHSKKQETQQKLEPMTTKSTSSCKNHHVMHKAKDVDTYSNSNMGKEDMIRYKDDDKDIFQEDEGQFMSAKTSYTHMEEKGISDSENDASMKQGLESYEDWTISENSQTRSDFDEDESCEMQFDTTHDWISDISRPKSDWEDMRQARYQEMLDPFSGHIDIRRLLERKNVSSFLASSLREKIDQLMMSRIQQSNVQVGKQVVVREKSELRKEVMAIEGKEYEREQNCSMVDEDGRMERQCCEYSGFVPPYLERSWRPNIDINSSSDPTTSPSLEQSISSNRSHNNGTPQSSSVTPRHPSIELELIYDLRGHMERLHQEITELRKSINSCVTMQIKMQHSFKQNLEVAATTRSVQNKEGKPPSLGKNDCCICNDMQVDSLLYRCGHMCACFKCALELQCTSGECPICEAPIMDVVKAFGRDN